MRKFIIPDIETTGKRTYNSKIVEVAAIVINEKFAEIERWGTLVNPGPEALALAQPKAMEVNKLTVDDLKDAPSTEEAAKGLQALLDRHPEATLHAFNNEFDSWFLARPPWNVSLERWGECIMLAAKKPMEEDGVLELRYNREVKYPNLREAVAYFNLNSETSHRAIGDARAAADVFIEIQRRNRSCPDETEHEQETKYFLREGL